MRTMWPEAKMTCVVRLFHIRSLLLSIGIEEEKS